MDVKFNEARVRDIFALIEFSDDSRVRRVSKGRFSVKVRST